MTVVFSALALNALVQVLLPMLGRSDDPPALTGLQTVIGIVGVAAAWSSWAGTRWAPASAALHGLATAGMLIALHPLLDLEPEARAGLWTGAAVMLAFGIWSAWYLRRVIERDSSAVPAQ